jgi:hypothetical protein
MANTVQVSDLGLEDDGAVPRWNHTKGSWEPIHYTEVVDARDFRFKGDGTTDDTEAMQDTINGSPVGSKVVFPLTSAGGAARISAPINLIEQRWYDFPVVGRRWVYQYATPIGGSVKTTSGFSGAAAFLIQGNEITDRVLDNDGIRVSGLVIDVGASSGNVHGIQVEGLCRDLSFLDCAVRDAQGTGNCFDFRAGTGDSPPRGIHMRNCAAYSGAANGFRFNGVTDSVFYDLLAVSNVARGIYVTNSGENDFTACRSVFNGTDGWFFDGTISLGLTTLIAPATDRNGQNGILISQSGTQPIQIVAPRLRRDGSTSTNSNYAGLRLSGGAGTEVVPVDVIAPQVVPGVDDDDTGDETPQFAVRALRAQRLTILGGDLWGVSAGLSNAGNNTIVEWSPSTYWAAGAIGAKAREFPVPVGQSFVDLVEQADPSAPSTNVARLYARDTGGKTELVVRFPTGAIQQVAIEP